ncbi:MAG: hypothetical protein KAY65_16120, partial [Planctomycetes bacterium]|nr:hypothetical protein [Planctomycetota bacterium]
QCASKRKARAEPPPLQPTPRKGKGANRSVRACGCNPRAVAKLSGNYSNDQAYRWGLRHTGQCGGVANFPGTV